MRGRLVFPWNRPGRRRGFFRKRYAVVLLGIPIAAALAYGSSIAAPSMGRQHDEGAVLEVPAIAHQRPFDAAATNLSGPGPVVQIPQRFAGCWTGQVSESDLTRVRMIDTPMIGAWLTKQYRVCFSEERTGLKATLADSSVARHEQVLQAKSTMTPVFASEGAIALRGDLRLVERSPAAFPSAWKRADVVEEQVELKGSLDYRGVMRVEGFVEGYYNGRAWFLAAWASDFRRQPSP